MIGRIVAATALLGATAAMVVWSIVRMPLLPPLPDGAATQALAFVRAAVAGAPARPAAWGQTPQRGLPVLLTLYDAATPVARGVGVGETFGAALEDAVGDLRGAAPAAGIDPARLARGRWKLDRVVGRGYLSARIAPLLALGVVPALDGVGAEAGGRTAYLTADDLVRERLIGGYQSIPSIELELGLDPGRLLRALAAALDQPGRTPAKVFRFRAEEHVEAAAPRDPTPTATPRVAVPIVAGHPPGPAPTREALASGARAGGRYLLAHLDEVGRFDYEYYLPEGLRSTAGYSIPRHAGAASFLAQLYALDRDPAVRGGAERALDELGRMRPVGCDGERICVGEPADLIVDLGASALSLVAAAEYQRTTGDARYEPFARGLTEFILSMQKADGDFCHLYTPRARARDEKTQLLYYTGEAAYGLARRLALAAPSRDDPETRRMADALDRALRYLTESSYATFAGQFYVGEDHWTCMAVDAGWSRLPPAHRDRYAAFCDAFAGFLRRTQLRAGDALVEAEPHLLGAYGITAALAPRTTPVGSRSETTVSMWRIARHRGLAATDPRVVRPREQVLDGMRFLLARQLDDDGAYLAADPEAARGGLPGSDVDRHVRIDFIQHSCSAMLRALELL